MKKYLFSLLVLVACQEAHTQCNADAGPDQTLTCVEPTVILEGSSDVPNAEYAWIGPSGFMSSQQQPTVNQAGVYTLTITDPSNNCTSSASAIVYEDFVQPDVSATGGTLTCAEPFITITGSSNTPLVTYVWFGPSGFTSTTQNPQVSQAGSYTLIVTGLNGCTATATAVVTQDASIPVISVSSTPASCAGSEDGSITINVTGGTPPYTYLWSNGVNTSSLTNLVAGTYTITVTDNVGCTATAAATISQPPSIGLNTIQIVVSPVTCFGLSNGAIALPIPTGGTPGFSYTWSNGSTAKNITGLTGGVYTVTISDNNSCTRSFQFDVPSPASPLTIGNLSNCDNTPVATVVGGTSPHVIGWRLNSPNGPLIATGPSPSNLPPGNYVVVVTDNNGCTTTAQFNNGPSSTPCTKIFGKIIHDEDLNCAIDSGEAPLGSWFIRATGINGTFYGISQPDGSYYVAVQPGDYEVSLLPQGYQPLICVNDLHVGLPALGDSVNLDFPVQLPYADCPTLSVDLSTPLLRRCFSNNYYHIQYCNNGPEPVDDAYVILELDPFLSIAASQITYDDLGNNVFRFNLGTIPDNFCDIFWVRLTVSCNAVLGQTHCSEVHIYPDSSCVPVSPMWSGAQLDVASECTGDTLKFEIINIGAWDMAQAQEYIVIEDGIMSFQGTLQLKSGESMVVASVPANGSTWRIEVDQVPFSPNPVKPVISVEGCSNTGSFSTGFMNQFSLGDNVPWLDIDCTPNIGSYDPNDKQGFPLGYGPDHYIRPGTELEYLIRFQNTGTDTAFNVVIRDTLSSWLEPTSIRPGASSHPYQFTLTGAGTLIFDFQNILLPDSNINEAASHGFVKFRVSPRTDVPLETDIQNSAAIYFDFNDPVITNTTTHRVGENFVSVGLWQPVQPLLEVQVTPHPLREASWISVTPTVSQPTGNYILQVITPAGQFVRSLNSSEPRFLLQRQDLPSGIYLFQIKQDGVLLGSGKLVVQ